MRIQYDKFLRLGAAEGPPLPTIYPFDITTLEEDGSLKTRKIRSRYELDLRSAVSVKIHKPDPVAFLMQTVRQETGVSEATLTEVFRSLEKHKALVLPDAKVETKDWLDQKMNSLKIRYDNQRKNLRNWFENPDQFPEVNFDFKNAILTVKEVVGGRVVVTPTGHTIAYSKAKDIYKEMQAGGSYSSYNGQRVSVGEYVGSRIIHRKYRLTINSTGVSVGCQTVPREAIIELAQREGW